MRILIFGAGGKLGRSLVEAADCYEDKKDILPISSKWQRDITDPHELSTLTAEHFDLIINAAAYTDVDGAELNPAEVYRVNTIGALNVTKLAKRIDCPLVHISTDYVYGYRRLPREVGWLHTEDEPVDDMPVNIYGKSKLFAEELIAAEYSKVWIIRTAALFSKDSGFLSWVLSNLLSNKEVPAISNQIVSPTYTYDLAHQIFNITNNQLPYGIYHCVGKTSVSWNEFARLIAETWQLPNKLIKPVFMTGLGRPAKRTFNSALGSSKLGKHNIMRLLPEVLKELYCDR